MLEQYSKTNTEMQVRSRRRTRRKKQQEAHSNQENAGEEDDNNSDDEEADAGIQTVVEKSFDFKRFSAKLCTQKTVDTFVALTSFYQELDPEQLKRAHRFFYRVAFKQELAVLLFRADIIALFYKMIKGPEGLDSTKPAFKEWEELIRPYFPT